MPVLPWEVATGTFTAGTVLAYQEIGLPAVAMLAFMLVSYYSLLRSVVAAQSQRDELRAQVEELEALHHGVIRVMVETLGMRDRMTARHSAAVARFAKAIAAAAGLPPRDQELVHTAGLLHDVGKFTFPDHTLTGTTLTEEDWALIRSHPQRGADIVKRVHGYAEVAEIVLCHHERVDGRGYPRRLSGEDIPVLARILSVADCFDVMTARDSYRTPISIEEAVAELRRVSGTQLDRHFVEIFVDVVTGPGWTSSTPTTKTSRPSCSGSRREARWLGPRGTETCARAAVIPPAELVLPAHFSLLLPRFSEHRRCSLDPISDGSAIP